MADRVVPNSLNYADIKPEAIESEIKFVKFTPTTNPKDAKGGDMVKFFLTGNGFMDPYSTSFRFTVEVPFTQQQIDKKEIRFLDRSAHSFIQRIVIRSQGVEIERIENYDVVAAMIHDVLYSPEQNQLHHWEGFPAQQFAYGNSSPSFVEVAQLAYNDFSLKEAEKNKTGLISQLYTDDKDSTGTFTREYAQGQLLSQTLSNAEARKMNFKTQSVARQAVSQLLNNASSPLVHRFIGEIAFGLNYTFDNYNFSGLGKGYPKAQLGKINAEAITGQEGIIAREAGQKEPVDEALFDDIYVTKKLMAGTAQSDISSYTNDVRVYPYQWGYHENGKRVCSQFRHAENKGTITLVNRMTFIIPIYSGLIGVLMGDKKLIPLNLLPLDIEVTFSPHALYSSHANDPTLCIAPEDAVGSRQYVIKDFNMYSHMIFFEQEIHRSLEAAVAEHGIFIYCNSFHQAPTTLIQNSTLPSFAYISMNLKSINSIHTVFYYNIFETQACARKLHFVSHNLTGLQVLNGTTLIPQEAIEGTAGSSKNFDHLPFLLSMYQAWNKLHDPKTDGAISAFNYCSDLLDGQADPLYLDVTTDDKAMTSLKKLINKQQNLGRCQYGISLEGEELGNDKTMITGRKSQYPFLMYLKSTNFKAMSVPSYMQTFLRADYIVYIRPDLQVVVLGK